MTTYVSAADDRGRMDFLARCIRGIEWIAAAEIETRLPAEQISLGHREVRFSTRTAPPLHALRLASADDLFLVVGDGDGLDATRATLPRLRGMARRLPWARALADLRRLRPEAAWSAFTISASSLGARNYNRYEVEEQVAQGASAALGLRYRPSRASHGGPELSIRVHLVDGRAVFGVRVFDTPLHRRRYKQHSGIGTLHPPLAAAMAMLAGVPAGARLLDPFAGVGTVAIEAGRLQPLARVAASDIDHARLLGAAANAREADVALVLARADGARLPWADGTFDRVVSNLPWGSAVAVRGRLARSPVEREREIARVLDRRGRAVLLVGAGDPLALGPGDDGPLALLHRAWVSVSGQQPRLCVLAHDSATGGGVVDVGAPWGPPLARWLPHADTAEV